MRKCGVLLPVSGIPSKYGIGSFSREAYAFVDFLKRAGQSYWQILPLGPTGYGDSPYQSFSTFAGNPYYIDLEELIRKGYLSEEDCANSDFGNDPRYVDYEKIYQTRFWLLKKAYQNSDIEREPSFCEFVHENEFWLDDYALYMAVKGAFGGKSWIEWDEDIRTRRPEALERYRSEYDDEIRFYQFVQYLFSMQWQELKKYANENGVEIIGDIPIYVAFDSADTWSHTELFQLDEACVPTAVAGCPPDAFSSTGQLWGNPLYRWDYHKETGYEWWMKRIAYCFQLYDVVRIDHFRGFDEYYSISYGDSTAEFGHWEKGPGYDIFRVMKEKLGDKPVIAEDLGFLTQSVIDLVKETGYPGMKILQFAFDSREESDYFPHNYTKNSVVYTGTHDNNTIVGWFDELKEQDKKLAEEYLCIRDERDIPWIFIRAALASVADTAIIPIQDYLGIGSEGRINTPSTLGNNWKWRLQAGECTDTLADKMNKLSKLYGRIQTNLL